MKTEGIGSRIQAVRRRRGMTQAELAELLDVTPKYVSNIECGAKLPRFETFIEIANVLEIDANTLLVDVLKVSDEIQCSELWAKIADLSAEKRQKALRMLELMVQEL